MLGLGVQECAPRDCVRLIPTLTHWQRSRKVSSTFKHPFETKFPTRKGGQISGSATIHWHNGKRTRKSMETGKPAHEGKLCTIELNNNQDCDCRRGGARVLAVSTLCNQRLPLVFEMGGLLTCRATRAPSYLCVIIRSLTRKKPLLDAIRQQLVARRLRLDLVRMKSYEK